MSDGDSRCRICKRRLTNPESIKIGVGPGCLAKIRGPRIRRPRAYEVPLETQLELPLIGEGEIDGTRM